MNSIKKAAGIGTIVSTGPFKTVLQHAPLCSWHSGGFEDATTRKNLRRFSGSHLEGHEHIQSALGLSGFRVYRV